MISPFAPVNLPLLTEVNFANGKEFEELNAGFSQQINQPEGLAKNGSKRKNKTKSLSHSGTEEIGRGDTSENE